MTRCLPFKDARTAVLEDDSGRQIGIDTEVRSKLDLKKVGPFLYVSDPSTEVLCLASVLKKGPPWLWWRGDPVPAEILEAAADLRWELYAHNAAFDSLVLERLLVLRHGWPEIPLSRWRCTSTMCRVAGLPPKLGNVADVLELEHRRDAASKRLMYQTTKPRKSRKGEDPAGTYYFDDQERLDYLGEGCKLDVAATRELFYRLPPLSAAEQLLWEHSHQINSRGFHVDRPLAEAARRIAHAAAPAIDAELAELTSGAVTGINQVAQLSQWLRDQGCTAATLNRKAVDQLLGRDDLPLPARRVLELRRGGAQAATKKIDALFDRVEKDDRLRGTIVHYGAATGRAAGVGFQPQNMKRPTVKDLGAAIAAVATGNLAQVKKVYPQPLVVVGDCVRPMINAPPGFVLIGSDFSSVESRILAWITGEGWKVDAYRRFDATHDPRDEPYCETACRIFGVPSGTYTKDSPERTIGKTCDLAFGYQGGLAAFRNFLPDEFTDDQVEQLKREWRASHHATVKFWHSIDCAAVLAVRERGQIVRRGLFDLKCAGAFLQIKLPSGRKLSYPQPRIIEDKHGKHRVVFADNTAGQFRDCRFGQGAYGGLWTENIVQAIARDLLVEAMLRIETAGYPIVLHIHDEIICEVPEGFGSLEEFTRLMIRKPTWALELPIAASAWTGPRYTK